MKESKIGKEKDYLEEFGKVSSLRCLVAIYQFRYLSAEGRITWKREQH